MKKLFLLFTTLPILEIIIYIQMGKYIGVIPTLLMILGTGIAGVILARQQGFITMVRAREEFRCGRVPGSELLDGLLIFTGAIFLLTPGLISDLTGFVLLVPFTRKFVRRFLKKQLKKWIEMGNINFFFHIR